ncbi:MAG: Txe/YoeB family addiction module toxin [Flavobacteriaceae bacterium]|nr:Txe/YoeB family addiction module toxin [Flavobacteriaceae bacterium]
MKVSFTTLGKEDFDYWHKNDNKLYKRILVLLESIKSNPFKGIGKPEPLKGNLSGYWSRRITQEHRLVYKITGKGDNQSLIILQCRFHY